MANEFLKVALGPAFLVAVSMTLAGSISGQALAPMGPATDSVCVDAQGVWVVPDGLVRGGPNDNSDQPAYAAWIERCRFTSTEAVVEVFTPFDEVVDQWLSCLRAIYVNAGHDALTLLVDDAVGKERVPASALASPATQEEAQEECGLGPDPSAVLPDGTVRLDVPMMHLGSEHGSIRFSSYSYASASSSAEQKGRMGIVFYGNGDAETVKARLLGLSHWKDAHDHHTGTCGETFYAYIWDAGHSGGSDKWWSSSPQTEAHHASDFCLDERYHIRHYGKALTDTHSPSFGGYSIANVHWDDWWHNNPDGAKGRNHLYAEYTGFADSHYQEWSESQQAYIDLYHIPAATSGPSGLEEAVDGLNLALEQVQQMQ